MIHNRVKRPIDLAESIAQDCQRVNIWHRQRAESILIFLTGKIAKNKKA
jgi:hypothetical protein